MDLEEVRKQCGSWNEEDGCLEDYPEDCPVAQKCKEDAEKVPVPA